MAIKSIAVVGSGFSGAVIAHELARSGVFRVTLFEQRSHIGGNCYTYRDQETGVMVHAYGPHIFHTNDPEVWSYVNKFDKFMPFSNRVKAISARGVFSLPINLLTINQFFGKKFNPVQARAFIESVADKSIENPRTFEEQALRFVGRDLYEAFFRDYTLKQWGRHPEELPASILQRLPVRFDYNDNYYSSVYQGMPENGYTAIFEKLLDDPAIELHCNSTFGPSDTVGFDHVFYSGPIDAYFGYSEGRLRYRTVTFDRHVHDGDFQGNAVINYCSLKDEHTRIAEHKHFAPWEQHTKTVCFTEFSKETAEGDTPFYPIRLAADKELLEKYTALASNNKELTFVGRLGTYRYLDMHVCIREALDLSREFIKSAGT